MRDLKELGSKLLNSFNYSLSNLLPSEWAEQKRVMSSDVSNFPGKYKYERTPYQKEIVNCLSPDNDARIIAVMKGAQVGFSTGVIENGIGWIIDQCPGPIILISGDKELSKEIVEKKIDQMIDSCGLRNQIRPNSMRKKQQRTGDTSSSKEFAGGYLLADGANNMNKLRQRSLMYGFIDDFEAAPSSFQKAGSTTKLIEQRFASYYSKMKLFYISTPEIKQTSNIEPLFLKGDQRYFHVICPCCGEYIVLHWNIDSEIKEGDKAGIIFDLNDNGHLVDNSVRYRCQKCGGEFDESDKYNILLTGRWIATAEPSEIGFRSYHLSALYAPVGMYNWTHYVRMFLDCYPNGLNAKADTGKLKTFLNVVLGQTYEERGRTPKSSQLSMNIRSYQICEVPLNISIQDGNGRIVMITCACDLNGKVDDARLDYEVLAWAENGSSYSIDHGSIGTFQRGLSEENRQLYTYRMNEHLSVWDILYNQVLSRKYISDDQSKKMFVNICGIDTGQFTHYAYSFIEFCQTVNIPHMTVGLKGEDDKIRKVGADVSPFRKSKEKHNLFIVEVNQIKDEVSEKLDFRWIEGSGITQPSGFMNFPEPADGKYTAKSYFSHYEGESKVQELNSDGTIIGHKWKKKHSSSVNHFWDCRIYNFVLKDIFVKEFLTASKVKSQTWADYVEVAKKLFYNI